MTVEIQVVVKEKKPRKNAAKKEKSAAVLLRMDRQTLLTVNARASVAGVTVQHMLRSLVNDLLAGRSAFVNPRGQVFVRCPLGGSPRCIGQACGLVAPFSEPGTAPR